MKIAVLLLTAEILREIGHQPRMRNEGTCASLSLKKKKFHRNLAGVKITECVCYEPMFSFPLPGDSKHRVTSLEWGSGESLNYPVDRPEVSFK